MRIALIILFGFSLAGCSNWVKRPGFAWSNQSSKSFAILPFRVQTLERELEPGMTVDDLREDERKEGIRLQRDLYRYFLRELSERGYEISIVQDYNETNRLLLEKEEQVSVGEDVSVEDLTEHLGVTAVISGQVQQMVAYADNVSGLLNGSLQPERRIEGSFVLQNADDRALWRYKDVEYGTKENTVYDISKNLLRKIPKKFPF